MLTVSNVAKDLLRFPTLEASTLWRIHRKDGTKHFWTDHDRAITYPYPGASNARQYTPEGAIELSNVRKQAGLRPHNATTSGVIQADEVTTRDIAGGRFREARVVEILFPWRYPHVEAIIAAQYWIGKTRWTGEVFEAEIGGLGTFLERQQGIRLNRKCHHKYGAAFGADIDVVGCRRNVATDDTVYGLEVTAATGDRSFQVSLAALSSTEDDFYKLGEVEWVSGENVGLPKMPVDSYTDSNRLFQLNLRAPFSIVPGDLFNVSRGCPGTKPACDERGQFANFSGHINLPSEEDLRTPPGDR